MRRLALLLAGDDVAGVSAHAAAEVAHLRSALGPVLRDAVVSTVPAANPMAGTGSMMATPHFATAVEVDVGADGAEADEALLAALDGFAGRHAGGIAPDRSTVLAGTFHPLRVGDGGAAPLKVMVAVHAAPGLAAGELPERWLAIGRVNAHNHPTCAAYGQLHADAALTARAAERTGLSLGPFAGLAVEVFPTAGDLHAGHRWAASPESVAGAPMAGAHLMELLGQVLDLGSAATLLAVEDLPPADHTGRNP